MADIEDSSEIVQSNKCNKKGNKTRRSRRKWTKKKMVHKLTQAELERNMQIVLDYLNRAENNCCSMSKIAAYFGKDHKELCTKGCVRAAVKTLQKQKLIEVTSRDSNRLLTLCRDEQKAIASNSHQCAKMNDSPILTTTLHKQTNTKGSDVPEPTANPGKSQQYMIKKVAVKRVAEVADNANMLRINRLKREEIKSEIADHILNQLKKANDQCCSRQMLLTTLLGQVSAQMTKTARKASKSVAQEAIELLVNQGRIEVLQDDATVVYKLIPASEPQAPTSTSTCSVEKAAELRGVAIPEGSRPQQKPDAHQVDGSYNSNFAERVVKHLAQCSQHRCSRQQLLASMLTNSVGRKIPEAFAREMELALERALDLLLDQGRILTFKTDSNHVLYQLNNSPAVVASVDLLDTLFYNPLLYGLLPLDADHGSTLPPPPPRLCSPDPSDPVDLLRDSNFASAALASPAKAADTGHGRSRKDRSGVLGAEPGAQSDATAQTFVDSDSNTQSDTGGDGVLTGQKPVTVRGSSATTLQSFTTQLRRRRGLKALQTSWKGNSLSVTDDYALSGGG